MSMNTKSPTHHALLNPDIVQLICEQVAKLDQKTLITLCRAGRHFLEPALNVVWYELGSQEGLGPLIRCMPDDLWEESTRPISPPPQGVGHVQATLSLRRPILATDWARFEINATRVRRFGFPGGPRNPGKSYKVDVRVYRALNCAAQEKKLLPQLREIAWDTGDNAIYPYLTLFLAPTVTRLELTLGDPSIRPSSFDMRLSIFPSLNAVCPSLTHARICRENDTFTPAPSPPPTTTPPTASHTLPPSEDRLYRSETLAVPAAIRQWTKLRCLSLVGVFDRTVFCAASLPALIELDLLDITDRGTDLGTIATVKGFPMLERLNADCCSINFCTQLINCMRDTPLRSLDLCFEETPPVEAFHTLFLAMQNGIAHHSLEHFSCLDSEPSGTLYAITLGEISPLLTFTHLLTVGITTPHRFTLDDEDVYRITLKWSRLRELRLNVCIPLMKQSRVTVEGLIAVAEHCPNLTYLSLAIDARKVHEYHEKPGRGVSNQKLEYLVVYASPIEDPVPVASLLSDIFPNLRNVTALDSALDPDVAESVELDEKWARVENLVKAFANVRNQERLYYTSTSQQC
ncbi:hypothetical protein AX17_006715 [Amanita inopinata Kibby_2008]|nr:hypothetical protein AX17_006715 [Amanita inopinata Kibby_2008]